MAGKTIVVTSGKGGVGKTTVTANLGMALASLGHKVCLIDTDMGLRNLDLVLGLEQRIIYDLIDVVKGHCRLAQALIHDRRQPNLFFLPASQRCDKSELGPSDMCLVVGALRKDFDFVLVDSPAGIEEGFHVAIAAADLAIVVVNADVSSVRDADRVIGLLHEADIHELHLVVNRLRQNLVDRNDQIGVSDIEELLGVSSLAVLPDAPAVIVSTNKGEPVALNPAEPVGRLFMKMAATLGGEAMTVITIQAPKGIFGRLKSLFV